MFMTTDTQAHVVIGGNMSYEFKGLDNNNEELVYDVFLNFDVVCELFDDESFSLVVFDELGNIVFDDFPTANLIKSCEVEPTNYECANIDLDYCIENRVYKANIRLKKSSLSYFIVFQHCCRASEVFSTQIRDLTNIESGSTSGITLFTEINTRSQSLNNSAPIFSQIKPNIVCLNEKNAIDFSVTDIDDDSLVYELVSPHNTTLEVGQLFPYDPPPYLNLIYKTGYSANSPFGINSPTSLNFENGKLLVEPDKVGVFVVGIKISEFRNGIKLSENYDDVRIYVDSCNPVIVASLLNQPEVDRPSLSYCNTNSIELFNGSLDTNLIDSVLWSINVGNEKHESNEWNASFFLDTFGTFNSSLFVYTETGCLDSVLFDISINNKLDANFEFEYDTCIAGPVSFYDSSISNTHIIEYEWQLGGVGIGSGLSFFHQFDKPDEFEITLIIKDSLQCRDSTSRNVLWAPAPETPVVVPDFNIGCSPLTVTFDNLSEPINEDYFVSWVFSENLISDEVSPTVKFDKPGVYSIDLTIVSPIGCIVDTIFTDWIRVEPAVEAGLVYNIDEQQGDNPDRFLKEAVFRDSSKRAISWEWFINDDFISSSPTLNYVFRDTGQYLVSLFVEDVYGCSDTVTDLIEVSSDETYYLPTAFTPNSDGLNDVYIGVGQTFYVGEFKMQILNRWGEIVFQSDNPKIGWDGRKKSNDLLPQGTFTCKVQYKNSKDETIHLVTPFVLIR